MREDCVKDENTGEDLRSNNGADLGTSTQTGWTGIIARALHLLVTTSLEQALELSKAAVAQELKQVVSS